MSPELFQSAEFLKVLGTAVKNLTDEINEDAYSYIPNIVDIHVVPDIHNIESHVVVYADVANSDGTAVPFKYAAYINTETLHIEFDAY